MTVRDTIEACLAAGTDDFVSKPVEPQARYATLLKWLERAQPPQEPQPGSRSP